MKRWLAVGAFAPAILMALGPTPSRATGPSFYTHAIAWDAIDPICDTGQVMTSAESCTQSGGFTLGGVKIEGAGISSADLSAGILTVSASSAGSTLSGGHGQGFAKADMFDTLTFHGPLSGNVVVTMSGTTNIAPGPGPGSGETFAALTGSFPLGGTIDSAVVCSPGASTTFCTSTQQGATVVNVAGNVYTVTETFHLASDPVLGLDFEVAAQTFANAAASATDPITISLPPGVTYTSASGVFPGSASVPEPATWAMLMGGLGMIGAAARRRRATAS